MSRRLIRRYGATGLALWLAGFPNGVYAEDTLSIQAVSRTLSEPVVRAIARAAAPTEPDAVPFDAAAIKTGDVVNRLCGGIHAGYWDELERLNKGTVDPAATVGDVQARRASDPELDSTAVRLRWPACVMLRPTSNAKKADTVPSETEAPPIILRPASGTTLTDLVAALDAAVLAVGDTYEIDYEKTVPLKKAHVVTAVDAPDVTPPLFPPCPSKTPAFDPQRVAAYYDLALRSPGRRDTVVVWVFDNGFYGQKSDSDPAWSEAYPEALFADWSGKEGRTGPTYKLDGKPVVPSNYNYAPTPNLLSGHGTHVTGLVLGGSLFQPYQSRFFYPAEPSKYPAEPEKAWLRLGVINLARGESTLIGGSQKEVASLLRDDNIGKHDGRIVNLSLAYEDADEANLASTFTILYGRKQDLFVVAAGNEGKPTILTQYPAKLGGPSGRNVITVAAHDDGDPPELTGFSNWGPTVDIAAPGCSLPSWIDMNATTKPLSGTSQATPLVTFAAVLLRSLDTAQWPSDLKVRLIASADLMPREEAPRFRLNIAKALLFKYDYIELKTGEIYIGKIERLKGLRCAKDNSSAATSGIAPEHVLAYKTAPGRPVLLYAGMSGALDCPPDISPYPGSTLKPYVKFTPAYKLDPIDPPPDADGKRQFFREVTPGLKQFYLDGVKELVTRSPSPGQFQQEGQ